MPNYVNTNQYLILEVDLFFYKFPWVEEFYIFYAIPSIQMPLKHLLPGANALKILCKTRPGFYISVNICESVPL